MSLETVTLVQFDSGLGPAEDGTLERVCQRVREAGLDSDLVVFPELATTGYSIFDRLEVCAETIPGPTTREVGKAAAEAGTHVLLGMAACDEVGVRNSAVWIDRTGEVRARYDKRQPWGDEREAFVPGEELLVVDCEDRTVGVQICYDLNFPAQSAAFARAEVDIIANISAWSVSMCSDWDRLLPARAIENGAFVLGCNHAGGEADLEFYGRSTVYNPDGSVAARLEDEPGTLTCRLENELLTRERSRNPMRQDRHPRRPGVERVRID